MPNASKFLVASALSACVASSALAGGLSGAAVEAEPFVVEETAPAGSLGGAGPLILLALVAAAVAAGGSSSGTN